MAIALRRFGGGMASWVTGCVIVAGVLLLWDAATCLWFFDGLFRLDIQAAQHPGFGSGVLRAVLGLFLGSPVWPIWAATIGASVAALAKLGRYRAAAVFGIGFGPALTTILEGGSPVSGKPLVLLVPVWLVVIAADTFLIWGLAWCIIALPKRAVMAKQETQKLRQLGGFPVIGRAAGFAAIFAGGKGFRDDFTIEGLQEGYERQARFNPSKAQRDFSRAIWQTVPELLRNSVETELLPQLLPKPWCRFLMPPR